LEDFDTYAETSPSGQGIKLFLRGEKPEGKCRRDLPGGHVELYGKERYFTVTGERYNGAPAEVQYRDPELKALHERLFQHEERRAPASPPRPVELADAELLNRMFAARNGAEVRALWEGDTSAHGGDASRADLALCSRLAFWTGGDAARIDALFRLSGLMRPKWERTDYRQATIAKALAGATGYYTPREVTPPAQAAGDRLPSPVALAGLAASRVRDGTRG
jgi:primase-polymerase (primpol)-like protein